VAQSALVRGTRGLKIGHNRLATRAGLGVHVNHCPIGLRHAMVRIGVLAALIGGCLAQNAVAAVTDSFRIGSWTGAAHSMEQSRQFDHCSASAINANGITVSYAVSPYRWSLTFSNVAWSFVQGLSLPLQLKFGERESVTGRAAAIDTQVLEVVVEDNMSLFTRLQSGGRLQAIAGGLTFEFQLIDSEAVLAALAQCVLRNTRTAQPAKPKRPPPQKVVQPALIGDATAIDELRTLAGYILGFARITDARLLTPAEVPAELRAGPVWKVGLVTIALSLLRSGDGATETIKLDELPSKLVDLEAHKCREGLFFLSNLDGIDQLPAARVFTSCRTMDAVTTTYRLALPRPQGGVYLVAVTATGGGFAGAIQRQTEQTDGKIRAVIGGALRRLERDLEPAR
jgi:hypothetical protein